MYYINIQGAATFNFAAAPYGLFDFSSAPPLFANPFITRASGQNLGQRFPVSPLPAGISPSNPDPNINWAQFEPISGEVEPTVDDKSPYSEHVTFSIQRQFASATLLSMSYVGTFGHHLLVNVDNNPGNPALCLSVSQPSQVKPGTGTCEPFGENGTYFPVGGGVINSTRGPFGPLYEGNGYYLDRGNSDYHALEVSLRHTAGRSQFLLSYTFSKAMDDGPGFGDRVLPSNYNLFEALAVFDMRHNFSFSYTYELPFDKLFQRDTRVTRGWKLSGITSFTTGVPVQISEPDDRSLLGSTGNSPQAGSTDEPNYTLGQILSDTNPRNAKAYFNTSLFSEEPLSGHGTASRRFFHGRGVNNWNLALLKDVKLRESVALEFRGEFFNVFNHAQFYGGVNGDFNAGPGSFGMVTRISPNREGGGEAQILARSYSRLRRRSPLLSADRGSLL